MSISPAVRNAYVVLLGVCVAAGATHSPPILLIGYQYERDVFSITLRIKGSRDVPPLGCAPFRALTPFVEQRFR